MDIRKTHLLSHKTHIHLSKTQQLLSTEMVIYSPHCHDSKETNMAQHGLTEKSKNISSPTRRNPTDPRHTHPPTHYALIVHLHCLLRERHNFKIRETPLTRTCTSQKHNSY